MLIGIFVRPCLYAGLVIIVLDVAASLIEQILICKVFYKDSDHPEFTEFQEALSKDGNWRDNVADLLNQKMSNCQNEIASDENKENK